MQTTSVRYSGGVSEDAEGLGWTALAAAAAAGDLVWIDAAGDDIAGQFAAIASAFDLPALAVEDTLKAHQRAKRERYGAVTFCVMRPAEYDDATETVLFGELHVFTGDGFIITVHRGPSPDIPGIREDLDRQGQVLSREPAAVLNAIMDRVVDDYAPVANGIRDDIDEIEDALFADGAHGPAASSRRIYELTREVIAFQRALTPLAGMTDEIVAGGRGADGVEMELLRDIKDHVVRLGEQVDGYRALLDNLLHVNLTLETKALGERSHAQDLQMKKVSSWAAIIFAPTLVGTIYGMNFDDIPELHWQYGYLFALGLMVAIALALYAIFKRKGWL